MDAYLVLENGKVFKGRSFGVPGEVTAEVVFATGMTGYLETLTDKSYAGQIVVQTFPLIGNYGVIPADFEGQVIGPRGYIVKEWCQAPSNFRSEGDLDAFFQARGVVGLCGIDTRSLTKIIRESGVMNGCITQDPDGVDPAALRAYRVEGVVWEMTTKSPYTVTAEGARRRVVLMDYGLKDNIRRELNRRGCTVTVMPADTSPADILAQKPDGIMLSNGPGDPAENTAIIENLEALTGSGVPIFGICLGHQLLALANGYETTKLKYGHRGGNQPVRNLETGRVYITSQNHGYAVVPESIGGGGKLLFEHVSDLSCEGIRYSHFPGFSVQFHPEASAGPLDTGFLFDEFMAMMEGSANAKK